jgi:hypothetical protein
MLLLRLSLHLPLPEAASIATPLAVAAAFLSLAIDAKLEFSSTIHRRIWTTEQKQARLLFRSGAIDAEDALLRWVNAARNLGDTPSLIPFLASTQGKYLKAKCARRQWIIANVLPLVARNYRSRTNTSPDFRVWLVLLEELEEAQASVDSETGFITRILRSRRTTARQIAERWSQARSLAPLSSGNSAGQISGGAGP